MSIDIQGAVVVVVVVVDEVRVDVVTVLVVTIVNVFVIDWITLVILPKIPPFDHTSDHARILT